METSRRLGTGGLGICIATALEVKKASSLYEDSLLRSATSSAIRR